MALEDIQTVPVLFFDQALSSGNLQFQEVLVRPKDFPALFGGDVSPFPGGQDPQIQWPAFPIATSYSMIPAGSSFPRASNPEERYIAEADWYLYKITSAVTGAGMTEDLRFGERSLTYCPQRQTATPSYNPSLYDSREEEFNSRIKHFWPKELPVSQDIPIGWESYRETDTGFYDSGSIGTRYLFWWEGADIGPDHLLFKQSKNIGSVFFNGSIQPNIACGIGGGGAIHRIGGFYHTTDVYRGYNVYAYLPDLHSFAVDSYVTDPGEELCDLTPSLLPLGLGAALLLSLADSAQGLAGRRRRRRKTIL